MRSIKARGVNFGMSVAYMISAEQRAIETVASVDISHSNIKLDPHEITMRIVLYSIGLNWPDLIDHVNNEFSMCR